jgi:biotin operon repressor
MPVLGTHKLTYAEISETVLIPNSFFSLFNAVDDFVKMFTIPSFLPPKINFTLPLPRTSFRYREVSLPITTYSYYDQFKLKVSIEGRFLYQDSPLKHISLNSKHGIFLSRLLENKNNFVSDQEILSELNFDDYRNLGYIKRDMKKALEQDGFKIELYRARSKGYKLVALTPIIPR